MLIRHQLGANGSRLHRRLWSSSTTPLETSSQFLITTYCVMWVLTYFVVNKKPHKCVYVGWMCARERERMRERVREREKEREK